MFKGEENEPGIHSRNARELGIYIPKALYKNDVLHLLSGVLSSDLFYRTVLSLICKLHLSLGAILPFPIHCLASWSHLQMSSEVHFTL